MKISNKVGYLRNWACSSHGDLKQEILGIVHIFGKGSLQHFSECIISSLSEKDQVSHSHPIILRSNRAISYHMAARCWATLAT